MSQVDYSNTLYYILWREDKIRIRRYMTVVSIFLIGLNRQHLSALEGKNFRQLNYKGRPYITSIRRFQNCLNFVSLKSQVADICNMRPILLISTSSDLKVYRIEAILEKPKGQLTPPRVHTTIIDAKLFTVRHVLCIQLTCSWHQKNGTTNTPIHEFKVLQNVF